MKRCDVYLGVMCIGSTCPEVDKDKYTEKGSDCGDCICYEGCTGCALYGTELCPDE